MVITFDNSDSAVQAFELLRVSHYEDKKLLGNCLQRNIAHIIILLKARTETISTKIDTRTTSSYNATDSQARFENKIIFFCFEKR
jgi:hypothetical protein